VDLREAAEQRLAQEASSSFLETPVWVIAVRQMAASIAGHSTAARTATVSRATSRGGRREPSDRLAQHGPLDGANFAPGQIFAARHRIVSLLGRGAMGEVYRAEDLRLGLLSSAVMLAFAELLSQFPMTFDFGAWYVGSSVMTLLLIGGAATYGFTVALAGRPAFRKAG
jgi:hypothetical protein